MTDPRLILLGLAIIIFIYIIATTAFAPTKQNAPWSPGGIVPKLPDKELAKAVEDCLSANFLQLRQTLDDSLAKAKAQNEKVAAEVKTYFNEVSERLNGAAHALEDAGADIEKLEKEFEVLKVQMNSLRLKVADGNRTFNISFIGADAKKVKPLLKRAGLTQ